MKSLLKVINVLIFLLLCTTAFAQDSDQGKTYIRFTPRAWFASINLAVADGVSTELFSLPMYGMTISLTPRYASNFTLLLTGLSGSGDSRATIMWALPAYSRASVHADRSDFEILVRYTIPDTNFSLYAGPRYIIWRDKVDYTEFDYWTDEEVSIWGAELGLGAAVPISHNGRHMFFSNFTFGLTYNEWYWKDSDGYAMSDDDTRYIIDFNAGYQYTLNKNFSFSARYRLFTFKQNETEVSDDAFQDQLVTLLGPELTLTLTF